MTDMEMLRRAMLLDPWDDLAIQAYCDEHEARAGWRPSPLTEWKGTLEEFLGGGLGVLFERNPVREVFLTNKYPLDNSGVEGYFGGDPHSPATSWFWIPQATPGVPWEVPNEFRIGWANSYATPEAALDALSLRAVNYGRRLAGLPHLEVRARV